MVRTEKEEQPVISLMSLVVVFADEDGATAATHQTFLIRCLLFPDNFKKSLGASFPFFLIFNLLLFWYTKF